MYPFGKESIERIWKGMGNLDVKWVNLRFITFKLDQSHLFLLVKPTISEGQH